ncbi:hypothetical protein AVEN_102101-1 [Araneus ventricosus]|uniref:C2H2-type domain-containing protein n=1 Tax=Araneus ventricosus TaxID=182803 RepID=A0A4Y2V3V4_ARAVE|nr:hypothetical protein AVEN_102101-1 [Araneus ventricosus]
MPAVPAENSSKKPTGSMPSLAGVKIPLVPVPKSCSELKAIEVRPVSSTVPVPTTTNVGKTPPASAADAFLPSWMSDPALREFASSLGPEVARTLMPGPPTSKPAFVSKTFSEIATSALTNGYHVRCGACQQPFSSNAALAQHVADTHSKGPSNPMVVLKAPSRAKLLPCDKCFRKFYSEKTLSSHQFKGPNPVK